MALRALTAVLAATAALALVAGPALASAPYTVTINGNITGTLPDPFVSKAPVTLTAGGLPLTCADSTLTANVTAGVYPSDPATIFELDPVALTDCNFDGFPATAGATTPWSFTATGGNTSGTDDTITGFFSLGFTVSVMGPLGICSFPVDGSVDGDFKEDNGKGGQELDIGTGLIPELTVGTVDNVLTCAGLVSSGDSANFTGQYNSDNQAVEVS